jgi:hypothetical protein
MRMHTAPSDLPSQTHWGTRERTSASSMVIPRVTHARFMVVGMSKQCALGLKSVAKATGTPPSIIARAGGDLSRSK